MLSKLFNGELGLKVTFWKFGMLGLIIMQLMTNGFCHLLLGHIKSVSILEYFKGYFNPIYSSKLSIFWTLFYLSSLLVLFFYSINIVKAIWRASEKYDKSSWLVHLSRIFIILAVALVWGSINLQPLL